MSSPAAEPDATDILTGRVAVNTTPSSTPSPAPSITASDVDDALVAAAGDADQEEAIVDRVVPAQKRISIYVQVFEEMIQTVMEHESFLFNEEEVALIRGFGQMSYEARYLFVRLFARKNGWFRVSKLKYADELGNVQNAVDELSTFVLSTPSAGISEGQSDSSFTLEESHYANAEAGPSVLTIPSSPVRPGYITIDDTDEELAKDDAIDPLTNRRCNEVIKDYQDFGLSRFAINEKILAERSNIDDLLALLSLDELKDLGKELKISGKTTRSTLIEAILRISSSQSTLTSMFAVGQARADARRSGERGKGKQRMPSLKEQQRSQTQMLIAKILAHLGGCIKLESGPIRLFARLHLLYYRSLTYSEKTLTQAVLARFKIRNYPSYTVKRSCSIFKDRQALVDYEDALIIERQMEELVGDVSDPSAARRMRKMTKEDRERNFRDAQQLFEATLPRWQQLVKEAQALDLDTSKSGLGNAFSHSDDRLVYYRKRFLAGWPLTRVVYKGTTVLAKLHEYERESQVLRELLDQSCFRRGKRGEWYDRLALVLMHHIKGDKDENRKEALRICNEGLSHPWTHLVYHNSLQRRIVRLERALAVTEGEKSPVVAVSLRSAKKRVMKGERLEEGETGKHSIWRSSDGAEISVEALALEQYNREGWKGFHSENGILTTIFALLFYDVIFAPVEGVFETAYQAAPLDLSTDAFAIVRTELVQERLALIREGQGLALLSEADDRERPNKTFCVGLRWAYEREDLIEIVQCLSATALAAICRVYAEEWSHRIGGVPDLFLWNLAEKRARFVEVKGPGDILSETQKVWIDVLMSAGVEVELCAVQEILEEEAFASSTDEEIRANSRKQTTKATKAKRRPSLPAYSAESDLETEKELHISKRPRVIKRKSSEQQSAKVGNKRRRSSVADAVREPSAAVSEVIILSD